MKILLFLAPFMVIITISDFSGLPQGLFLQLSAILIVGISWINWCQKGFFVLKKNPLFLPVGLWIIWITFSLFVSTNPYEGILIAKQWWTGGLFFLIISGCSREKSQTLLPVLFWSGFFVALIGLFQFFMDFQWIPQVRSPSSTFGHKNVAIHYIMLTLPAGISIFISTSQRWKNICYGFALTLVLLYIYTTYTRAGWVVLFFMLVFLAGVLFYDHKKLGIRPIWYSGKSVPLLVGIIFALILLNTNDSQKNFSSAVKHMAGATQSVFEQMSNNVGETSQISVIDNSFTGRLEVWINSLAMVKNFSITGTGVGNYRIHFQKYQNQVVKCSWVGEKYRVFNAHNDHIQFLVELGFIGLGLWLFLLWRLFRTFYFTFKQDLSPSSRYLLICPLLAVINVLVNACFSFPFQMSIPPVLFMVYLGILCSWTDNDMTVKINIPKRTGYTIAVLFCFLFLFLLNVSYSMIQSDRHFLKMLIAERINKWPMVISEAKKVLKYNPYRQEVYSFIGRAELESGHLKKAIVSFDCALKSYPYHINSIANKGMALQKLNMLDQAALCFKESLHYLPILIKIRKMLANIYISQNKLNETLVQELILIREHEPDNINLLSNLAMAYMKTSKIPEAISTFKTILEHQPDNATANAYMALFLLNTGQVSASEKFYENINQDGHIQPQVFFILGQLALELQKKESLNFFIKASQMDTNCLSQLFELAISYKNKKKIEKAIKAYQIIIHIHPSNAGAHNNLGNIYRAHQMNQKAFKEYLAAVAYAPQNALFHFNAGLMAIQLEKFQTAEQALKKAIQIKPDWALAHKNLAVLLYEKLKRQTEAIYYFSRALTLDPMIENHETIRLLLIRHSQNFNPYHQKMGEKQ